MGDFGKAVSTLLESFSSGLAVIKRLRRKRKETRTKIDPSVKAEEERLSNCLETNKRDIKSAYDRCAQARNFAAGDAEAEYSLASILLRLNAGFVNIIDRFVKGKCTYSDYRTLLNLSNASTLEAIQSFEQLQYRLSQSSLSLGKKQLPGRRRKRKKKHSKKTKNSSNNTPSQSSASSSKKASGGHLKKTYLGPATSDGWIRMKHGKTRRASGSSGFSTGESSTQARISTPDSVTIAKPLLLPPPQPMHDSSPDPKHSQRFSIMSFATTSTRIGEIPEHKWARAFSNTTYGNQAYHSYATPVFPLQPYVEPEKQRSRFMKIFKRDR